MDLDLWKLQMVRAEGNKGRIYQDSEGNWSGGIGRNLSQNGLYPSEVALMFDNDTTLVLSDLRTAFPWWLSIDDVRQRAFAEMRFNLGPLRFRMFVKMLAAAAIADWATASAEIEHSEAATQLPSRYARIAAMIRTGTDPQS